MDKTHRETFHLPMFPFLPTLSDFDREALIAYLTRRLEHFSAQIDRRGRESAPAEHAQGAWDAFDEVKRSLEVFKD